MHHLEIRNISSSYGKLEVLRDVTLSADKGEVVSLIGPSGSGKSTLLRVLIGLTPPTGGNVYIGGNKVDYNSRKSLKDLRGHMAIVFQQYNLFQNMNVLRNVTIAPVKIKKKPREEAEVRARGLLQKVGMEEKADAYPDELSGGQQQRVAIARALATSPEILLLDEVTSALDPERVKEVLDTIRSLTHEGITLIIVSHEMAFVREVSTRVAMMDQGKIVEVGPPEQIFRSPVESRTRDFVSKILSH
ncbi:MAG: amino acid ABC transporter ATP-binding protein [Gammaproteobacteria bacterium]|nr:amino acid ABC transporter ATP-binding protein [Gammaproteobacteria bacterium]MDH4254056.1 amino acid ABC transporter ATP-binding protein [Gammaproteobacteria bacterium]MDH5309531.1 amino acid ABC transporter ATP-binding protein [Gammaproteobacteria bacterium]